MMQENVKENFRLGEKAKVRKASGPAHESRLRGSSSKLAALATNVMPKV